MFILMLMAIYGIIGELSHPGAILPGVAGAIALILVLYMSAMLPVNIAGSPDRSGARAVHHGYFCADARRIDRRRHRRVFSRRADAVQSRAGPGYDLSLTLDHSGDARHGGIFYFCRQQRHPRAIQAGTRRARKR